MYPKCYLVGVIIKKCVFIRYNLQLMMLNAELVRVYLKIVINQDILTKTVPVCWNKTDISKKNLRNCFKTYLTLFSSLRYST